MLHKTITILFLLQLAFIANAQICTGGRYLNRVFPNVIKTSDIHYATVEALPMYLNETQTVQNAANGTEFRTRIIRK